MGIEAERVVHDRALLEIVELVCPICGNLLSPEDTVETPCGHLFCSACVAPFITSHSKCPQDLSQVQMTDLKPVKESNTYVYRMLGRSLVRCVRHGDGCNWVGELSEAAAHSSQCSVPAGQRLVVPGSSTDESLLASLICPRGRERGEDICFSCDEKNFQIAILRSEVDQKVMEIEALMLKLSEISKENEEKSKQVMEMQQMMEMQKETEIGMLRSDVDKKIMENGELMLKLAESLKEKEEKCEQAVEMQQDVDKLRDDWELMLELAESLKENEEKCKQVMEMQQGIEKLRDRWKAHTSYSNRPSGCEGS
ncbi:hypothetical protein CBR_g34582 [Chara braunii]|uniref:RING-type domain-containing protein n=1 Tax=Chara braunii TaxID=69332 RepID=A0A388LJ08_CHABU|nr:hypothetical protein CBR_g34582 [Chara braunii]|eukprot:GBG82298.1 hypothetical protein CBR_g34582 [Chara braunii]